ncbi:PREDICTED: olfactory receptor 2AG1-like [Ceratotherium simum simum]|uniref:Olfactory receptor 2AG1-like n=1 Tax=Ceratotherium simum simum TaxID=73337 RepID=A0ABM1CL50_CERSS|nr:PREDICTED: olfactory receptor 2AG1-like [Ceratotherium simum simum]
MEHWNSTLESGFILMGILNDSGSPELLCAIIAVLYMLALTSNGLLFLVITMDAQLHVPMYLLLGQLSLMDLLFTSVVTPKAIVDFLCSENTISFGGCALQMFLALMVGSAEDLLLAFMAYDRYVAICYPLNYMVLMRPRLLEHMFRVGFICPVTVTHDTDFCRSQVPVSSGFSLGLGTTLQQQLPEQELFLPVPVALQSSVDTLALQEKEWRSGSDAGEGR